MAVESGRKVGDDLARRKRRVRVLEGILDVIEVIFSRLGDGSRVSSLRSV